MDRRQSEFVIQASAAESMARSLNLPSVLHLLPLLLHSSKSLARPPVSNYHVAAVGLGSDGRIFIGVNLEFPGLPLHHSVHAEQFLLTNLAIHGCDRLIAVAVSSAPCGHCRQFFQEVRHSASLQILILENEIESNSIQIPDFMPLSTFLPNPFGPHDLLDEDTPLLLEHHDNQLALNASPQIENLDPLNRNNSAKLSKSALEAANKAHAPYSGCPSGIALMDCEGVVYRGSYAESAAYNPSLGPVQCALVAYVVGSNGGDYERIVAAALVEKEGAKVKQEDTARLLLKAVSPKCEFQAFACQQVSSA